MKLLFSFVFCILLSIAFCDEGPQTSSRKDVFSSLYYHGDMATDDVNDDTPLSVMAHAYLRHNDERNSEDMKLVAEDTENDKFFPERRYGDNDAKINSDDVADNVADGDDGPPDNVADGDDDVADENDEFFPERLPRRRRRRGDNDAKINSDDVADNVADGDDGPPDNVADGDDDVADENDGSSDNVADGDDDVADDNDDVADEDDEEDDDVADDDEEEDDDAADDDEEEEDDAADDDEEEEDDENDEEFTYHYIVYDQDPNNDEQIKEFYASDEIPDEVIEKIIADDYEEY